MKHNFKKIICLLICTLFISTLLPITASADTGPKASVRITFENMGDELCYGTLLSKNPSIGRSFYSFGWMLDIARCIYTLRTGKIIAKTDAAEWALENNLCPDPDALRFALKVRRSPLEYKDDKETFDYAETLAEPIQRFADILEKELRKY